MNAEEFVGIFKKEKEIMMNDYLKSHETKVNKLIKELNLSNEKMVILKKMINILLTDAFYTVLMGLDGEANIGGTQQTYKIYDENDNLISDCGNIESAIGILLNND